MFGEITNYIKKKSSLTTFDDNDFVSIEKI